jgi:hypothetical protein
MVSHRMTAIAPPSHHWIPRARKRGTNFSLPSRVSSNSYRGPKIPCRASTTKWVIIRASTCSQLLILAQAAEVGGIQALCKFQAPRYVPLYGSISYTEVSTKIAVSEDRLKHLIRIAAVCSDFLAETKHGEVEHSENSRIWQLDPLMSTGMEVMLDHLPSSSFKLGEVCVNDPVDEKREVCGFSLARQQPLYSYPEAYPKKDGNLRCACVPRQRKVATLPYKNTMIGMH